MRCLNCTARVLRVFIHGGNPSLSISRIAALPRAPPRTLQLLKQSFRHHYTSAEPQYSEDEDYIPMVTSTVESTRDWHQLAGIPPPPPYTPEPPRDYDPAPKVLKEIPTPPSTQPIPAHRPNITAAPDLNPSPRRPKKTSESAEARRLRHASLAPAIDAAWRDYVSAKESKATLQPTEPEKKSAWAKKKAKDAAEKEARLARRAEREAAGPKREKPTQGRKCWNLPNVEARSPMVERLAAHIAATPNVEKWKIAKLAVKRKLGNEAWRPEKRLSPDAVDGIRTLNSQLPDEYNMETLSELFQTSPEAVRRILKNRWMPKEEEIKERNQRWGRRKVEIWTHWLETGEVVNKSEKRKQMKEERRKIVGGGGALEKEWREALERGLKDRKTDGRKEHARMVKEESGPFTDLRGRLDV